MTWCRILLPSSAIVGRTTYVRDNIIILASGLLIAKSSKQDDVNSVNARVKRLSRSMCLRSRKLCFSLQDYEIRLRELNGRIPNASNLQFEDVLNTIQRVHMWIVLRCIVKLQVWCIQESFHLVHGVVFRSPSKRSKAFVYACELLRFGFSRTK